MLCQPFVGEFHEGFPDGLIFDYIESLAHKRCDKERLGLGFGNATRHQIEEMIMVQITRSGPVAADHVISEDFEFGFGVELGGF